MKTKNRVLSGLLISAILASGLFATSEVAKKEDRVNGDKLTCTMKKEQGHKMDRHQPEFFGIFGELNLSNEQKTKIDEIIQDSRKNIKSSDEAFSKDGFDKAKYIEIMSERRDNMIKSEAEIIEKTYAILTDKQKEQLKTLIDLRKERTGKK